MGQTFEQIIKVFTHLAREVQIYLFSGALFLIQIHIIFHPYLHDILQIHKSKLVYLSLLLISYLIGHTTFSIYNIFCCLFELNCKKEFKKTRQKYEKRKINFLREVNIYKKNDKVHTQFIERYNILYQMRCNLAVTLLLLAAIAITYRFFNHNSNLLTVIIIVDILSGLSLLSLFKTNEESYNNRLTWLHDYIKNENTN
ncbi:MAG: hypothetical protein JXB17_07330 [Bacteroidales bacterium]|nr:hypothetical protein [Bacteroidales bacterium]